MQFKGANWALMSRDKLTIRFALCKKGKTAKMVNDLFLPEHEKGNRYRQIGACNIDHKSHALTIEF